MPATIAPTFAAVWLRSVHKTSIGDEANDGAEHGCDQDIARAFIDLIHRVTMRRADRAIKSQLIQIDSRPPLGNGPV
ncbi:MAG TPA: hypothetical protein VII24_00620 [Pseudolabrys sp.]|jgi:hypothetical protein